MDMFQFITHFTPRYSYLDAVHLALAGGCRWIQLRMKDTDYETSKSIALEAKALCRNYGATFIIDDHVGLAKEIHADGVHLGKNDMPISLARNILGKDYIIGGTANTFEDVVAHYHAGADYIGCGPFRYTSTKENLSPILGLEGYRSILDKMKKVSINIPLVAIGGITISDIPTLIRLGVNGIGFSGSILNAEDPISETTNILNILNLCKS